MMSIRHSWAMRWRSRRFWSAGAILRGRICPGMFQPLLLRLSKLSSPRTLMVMSKRKPAQIQPQCTIEARAILRMLNTTPCKRTTYFWPTRYLSYPTITLRFIGRLQSRKYQSTFRPIAWPTQMKLREAKRCRMLVSLPLRKCVTASRLRLIVWSAMPA